MQYDYAVFIGRFQPFHKGHYHVATEALKIAKKLIFVLGSHDSPRTPKNPFTTLERQSIIREAFSTGPEYTDRITWAAQVDHTYNEDRWIASIQSSVNSIALGGPFNPDPIKIALVGYSKDHSSYYLRKFPQWDLIEIEPEFTFDATGLRKHLFLDPPWKIDIDCYCVNTSHKHRIIGHFSHQAETLKEEFQMISEYKAAWNQAPYAPTFVTVDAVVTQAGHILLVRRRAAPGKGLWALPGGFVNQTETLKEAVLRELVEETSIKVPLPALAGSVVAQHTYDAPDRSLRGRTITEAYHFKLNDMGKLPRIKGSDDADKAKWVPFSEFVKMRPVMFEDHYNIVEHMLGI